LSEEREFSVKLYEEQFYREDSAIVCARIIQMKESRVVAVIQFRKSKNLWDDLTWAPHYDEISFVLKTIYEAEDYNNFAKNFKEGENIPSFSVYRDMMRVRDMETHHGWVRIGKYEYHFAGKHDEIIVRRPCAQKPEHSR